MEKITLLVLLLTVFFTNTGTIEAVSNTDSKFRSLFLKDGPTASRVNTNSTQYTSYEGIIKGSVSVFAGLAIVVFIYQRLNESKHIPLDTQGFLRLCASGKLRRVRIALKKGANVNAADSSGKTALMYAASKNRNPKVISLLLQSGADASIRDRRGKTAADYAGGNDKIALSAVYKQLKKVSHADARRQRL
ncbi:hypothetical protein AGMMS49957_03250 [Synergistales bacterium]|nr:hypothetical protein AGMMS49957_03250 [Synergistales bacterium]